MKRYSAPFTGYEKLIFLMAKHKPFAQAFIIGKEFMVDFYWKSTEVSFDVAFITHDGATWCFRDQDEYKGTLKFGRIRIGNS